MILKRRGYLLVDISVALLILSILSMTVFTFYKIYISRSLANNLKIECMQIFNSVAMEVQYNCSYDNLKRLDINKKYYLNTTDINAIVSSNIIDLLSENEIHGNEYCTLIMAKNEDKEFIDIEVEYYMEKDNFKYNDKEYIRIYSFIL